MYIINKNIASILVANIEKIKIINKKDNKTIIIDRL